MRGAMLGILLTVGVLLPRNSEAQAMQFKTPAPEVTAAGAGWQVANEPIVVSGKLEVLKDDPMGLYYRLTDAVHIAQ